MIIITWPYWEHSCRVGLLSPFCDQAGIGYDPETGLAGDFQEKVQLPQGLETNPEASGEDNIILLSEEQAFLLGLIEMS